MLSESALRDPVASLFDEGPPTIATGELARVVRRAAEGSEPDAAHARSVLAQSLRPSQIDWRLRIHFGEREDFADSEFVSFDGVTFAMSRDIQRALRGYTLECRGESLVLIGSDEVAKSLNSIKSLSIWEDN
jgi:hypothetical protein